MKKSLFVTSILLSFLLVAPVVSAHEETAVTTANTTAIPETPEKIVEDSKLAGEAMAEAKPAYTLPYPGILPDHPLYFLKRFRDQVLDFFITDPLRQSEFSILQADKRLGMGIQLMTNGKAQLAEETVSKGTKYMDSAVSTLLNLQTDEKQVPGYLVERLQGSLQKHEDIIVELMEDAPEDQKAGLNGSLEIIKALDVKASELK